MYFYQLSSTEAPGHEARASRPPARADSDTVAANQTGPASLAGVRPDRQTFGAHRASL